MTFNARNINLLSNKDLADIKKKYNIRNVGDNIIVSLTTRDQTTMHRLDKNFNLRVNNRKFTITSKASKLWVTELKRYNLLDIQHSTNVLIVNKLSVTSKNIQRLIDEDFDLKKIKEELKNETKD